MRPGLVLTVKPPSKAALRTSSRQLAVTKLRSCLTLLGISSRSFSFLCGIMICFSPARCAASTLSLIPPTCQAREDSRQGLWSASGPASHWAWVFSHLPFGYDMSWAGMLVKRLMVVYLKNVCVASIFKYFNEKIWNYDGYLWMCVSVCVCECEWLQPCI